MRLLFTTQGLTRLSGKSDLNFYILSLAYFQEKLFYAKQFLTIFKTQISYFKAEPPGADCSKGELAKLKGADCNPTGIAVCASLGATLRKKELFGNSLVYTLLKDSLTGGISAKTWVFMPERDSFGSYLTSGVNLACGAAAFSNGCSSNRSLLILPIVLARVIESCDEGIIPKYCAFISASVISANELASIVQVLLGLALCRSTFVLFALKMACLQVVASWFMPFTFLPSSRMTALHQVSRI